MPSFAFRALKSALAAPALLLGGVTIPVTSAEAAATTTVCPAGGLYVNEAIMQTSTRWGRAGERVCWEYSDTQMRARADFRIDWPSNCTLNLGYKAGSTGCPTQVVTKLGRLNFHEIQIPVRWAGPDGVIHGDTCSWSNQTAWDMSAEVWTCPGAWMPIQKGGRYYSGVAGAGGDVKDDGDGMKLLDPVGRYLNFT
jgi:hypothetical protein